MDGTVHQPTHAHAHGAGALTRALVATLALAIALGAALTFPTNSLAAGRSKVSQARVDELARDERHLLDQIKDLQTRANGAQGRYAQVERMRDKALDNLTTQLVLMYQAGDNSSMMMLLAAGDVPTLIETARLSQDLNEYQLQLVQELDDAEMQARIDKDRRDILAQQLANTRMALDAVQAELAQARDAVARKLARKRARELEAAQAQAAQIPQVDPTALLASYSTVGIDAAQSVIATGSAPAGPASATSIDAYLASKGSPMAGNGFFFMLSGRRWGIDPRLLVAISGAESNFGDITCGPNNAWGWACPNSPANFETWAAGIETVTSGLRRYYIDEGRTTVVLIQQKYAPSGAANDPTGLNNNWVTNVTRFLVEQGGSPTALVTGEPQVTAAGFGGSGPFE